MQLPAGATFTPVFAPQWQYMGHLACSAPSSEACTFSHAKFSAETPAPLEAREAKVNPSLGFLLFVIGLLGHQLPTV